MAFSLIALGSNLGDRGAILQRALAFLAELPQTQLMARSRWFETAPIGGPAGQQPFLNGAALFRTPLSPRQWLGALASIEAHAGRERVERWAARTLDLDLLLYDELVLESPNLTVPHPRMAWRPFVLQPAAEAAPWMVHAECGWTVGALLRHLTQTAPNIAVAGDDAFVGAITEKLNDVLDSAAVLDKLQPAERPVVYRWSGTETLSERPKLLLAATPSAGTDKRQLRKMLNLPKRGPVAWISAESASPGLDEALAALCANWPALA